MSLAELHAIFDALLTPHGVTGPPVAVKAAMLCPLLTPHGVTGLGGSSSIDPRRLPPNPSWGDGTDSASGSSTSCISPNPSWGDGTAPGARRGAGGRLLTPHGVTGLAQIGQEFEQDTLLTPHGVTGRPRPPPLPRSWAPPNPSWGDGTPAGADCRHQPQGLLTPHGVTGPSPFQRATRKRALVNIRNGAKYRLFHFAPPVLEHDEAL